MRPVATVNRWTANVGLMSSLEQTWWVWEGERRLPSRPVHSFGVPNQSLVTYPRTMLRKCTPRNLLSENHEMTLCREKKHWLQMSHFASMLFWWFLQGVGFAPDSYWMWLLMRCSLWSKPDWPVGHVWPTSYVWPWLPLVTLSLPMSFPFFDCWILQPGFRIMRSLLNPKIFQPALLHSWVKTWKDLKSKRGKELLRCLYAHSIKPRQSCLKILDLLYLDELHILPTANDNIEAESEPFHAVLAWTEADVMQVHIYDGTGHAADIQCMS